MTESVTAATPAAPPRMPSVHIRALITWVAIFPLVTLGLAVLTPFMEQWPLVLRSLVLTAIVVPLAVYLVVPAFLRGWARLSARR